MARLETIETPTLPGALKRARKAAGFSNARDFLAAVKVDQGKAPSYSTYAQWESGEVEPREDSLAVVRDFHKARKTWVEPATAPDLATALAALARSTQAMADELAAMRQEREGLRTDLDGLKALVGELLAEIRPELGPEGSGANGAPAGTTA